MTRPALAALALLLLFPSQAFCGATSFGEIFAAEPSVRANGMADAYAAAGAGDVWGSCYNPAHSASRNTAAFMYQRGYADDSTGALAFSLPRLVGGFNLGLSLLYYNSGEMDLFTSAGSHRSVIGEKDYVASAALSRSFGGYYSAGAALKLGHTALFEDASASATLLDLGIAADFPLLRIGAAVQNLGGNMKLGSEDEHIPSNWRIGASRSFGRGGLGAMSFTLASELYRRQYEPAYVRFGAEIGYSEMLALRLGYELRNSVASANTLRFGAGFIFRSMTLDYAMVPYQDLGATHRVSVAWRFGRDASARLSEAAAAPALHPQERPPSP
ncbi:MAG: PorV/PorQ family protein [Elusimicrobia bacterium]|nr:PorV/PorQ family protein [Elusimicrobiota bacterium]